MNLLCEERSMGGDLGLDLVSGYGDGETLWFDIISDGIWNRICLRAVDYVFSNMMT